MTLPGRFNHSAYLQAETIDIAPNKESCLRVDGTATGATVTNQGPVVVQNAVAVEPDSAYGAITSVAVGATQAVAANTTRDFWPTGAGRCRLRITRP